MSAPDILASEQATSDARAARVAFHRAREAASAQNTITAGLRSDVAVHEAQIHLLTAQEQDDDARRVLDGEETVPPDTKRTQRLARHRERAKAITAAIPVAERRVVAAQEAAAAAEAAFVETVVTLCSTLRSDAALEVTQILATAGPALARLMAVDRLSAEFVGINFRFDPSRHENLFSGDKVARKFLAGLPDRLRPVTLNLQAIDAAAMQLAIQSISILKEA